jgi:predicted GNAT family acetyltransferase
MMDFRDAGGKYQLIDGGEVVGVSVYRDSGERRVFTHTEIDAAYAGSGLASKLVRFALDDARAKHKRVVPICPMVSSFIGKYPEYEDLVDRAPVIESA